MQNITTWPGWETVRKIGTGSFGTVYEIQREDFGHIYKAALKVISIPQSESDIQRVKATGMNEESVTSYFRGFVEDFVQEIKLMDNLKGDSNVVSYEDHMVIPFDEGVGWNILIRMELLKPILQHFQETSPMEEDILRMGIDICRALEKCSLYGIIHRDIKPENIFINDRGDYKLGDFGVARTAERTASGMSVKGTYSYMAPEVYKEQPYDAAVDIYSLGIVLYQYLNNGRGPFLPAYPEDIRYSDEQKALSERMNGRRIPAPVNGSRELKEAVLKAAAYDPAERYGSARELREDLERILMLNHGKGSDLGSFSDDVRPRGRTMGIWDTDGRDGRDKGDNSESPDSTDVGGKNGGKAERPDQEDGPASDSKKKSGDASGRDEDTPKKVKTDPEEKKKTGPEEKKKVKTGSEKKKRNLFMILGAAALILIAAGMILLPKLRKPDEDKTITTAEEPTGKTTGPEVTSAEHRESETEDHSEAAETDRSETESESTEAAGSEPESEVTEADRSEAESEINSDTIITADPDREGEGWCLIEDKWYYFDADGTMLTDWQEINGAWFYLGSDGVMRTYWQNIGNSRYYFGAGGGMETGWRQINGKWYYFGLSGEMQTGWLKQENHWYYLKDSGERAEDETITINGKSYSFDASGVRID